MSPRSLTSWCSKTNICYPDQCKYTYYGLWQLCAMQIYVLLAYLLRYGYRIKRVSVSITTITTVCQCGEVLQVDSHGPLIVSGCQVEMCQSELCRCRSVGRRRRQRHNGAVIGQRWSHLPQPAALTNWAASHTQPASFYDCCLQVNQSDKIRYDRRV